MHPNNLAELERLLGIDESNAPCQPLDSELLSRKGIELSVKRDDLLHPIISGNKWRKLKGILTSMGESDHATIVSMGGAWSNFQHCLSYLCQQLKLKHIALTRFHNGQTPTATMLDMENWGSHIVPLNRIAFRKIRAINSGRYLKEDWLNRLSVASALSAKIDAGDTVSAELLSSIQNLNESSLFWLAEGGDSIDALCGFESLVGSLKENYDYIVCASATGISIAGLMMACQKQRLNTQVIGIAVLNNAEEQRQKISSLLEYDSGRWQIEDDFTMGGFAKSTTQLNRFVEEFNSGSSVLHCSATGYDTNDQNCSAEATIDPSSNSIPDCLIEPVYSGKSFYAVSQLIQQDFFKCGSRILLVHCGGLQGARS